MEKELISSLKPLVNSREWREIEKFVVWRKEQLFRSLLQADSYDSVNHIRGQVEELTRLLRLRDDVNKTEEELIERKR